MIYWMGFEDLFSQQAEIYAQYRPEYPAALFATLAALTPALDLAWDCATGNGQAARGAGQFFTRVAATDASLQQIRQRHAHPHVFYWVAQAEAPGLPTRGVDLITVAQAIHWFNLPLFYQEARRVLKPGGVLACWSYYWPEISSEIEALLREFYFEILGPYWAPGMAYVEAGYRNLPFPFEDIPAPELRMETQWTLPQFFGFLKSWSAVPVFQAAQGFHPLEILAPRLGEAWGPPDSKRSLRWSIQMRLGRNSIH